MANITKRRKSINEKVEAGKVYPLADALDLLKAATTVKFSETIDIAVKLGVDAKKSDQAVRGAVSLPNGTGKSVRIAVFAEGEQASAAEAAGADRVGFEDLAEEMKSGKIDYDVVLATPNAMRAVVGKLGQVLGPRGLMPNPKVGTVAADMASAVKTTKAGQARFRTEKGGIVHCLVGKINFETQALRENINAVIDALRKAKPSSAKGIYLKKLTVSSTMGPGLQVDISSLES